jgi:Phage terminase, small subunit
VEEGKENSGGKLTPKQEMFCREFIVDLNATQAAIRAGYSKETAKTIASQILTKLNILERIAELKEERNSRLRVDADYVLKRSIEIDTLDVKDILDENDNLLPIKNWPKAWRMSVSGIEITQVKGSESETSLLKKIKWPDKVKNLELLGKHVDVAAFKEKVELSGDGISDINVVIVRNKEDLKR